MRRNMLFGDTMRLVLYGVNSANLISLIAYIASPYGDWRAWVVGSEYFARL